MAVHGDNPFYAQVKLLMIGESGCGKTCLVLRYTIDSITPTFLTTVGIDFKIKTVVLDGKRIKLQIWDTGGQERFRSITTSYLRGAQGIFLVYDVTDRLTFTSIRRWMGIIQTNADVNVNTILVGNKCDMVEQRVVSRDEGEALAKEYNIHFVETSAKLDQNVQTAFITVVTDVIGRLVTDGPGHATGGGRLGKAAAKPLKPSNLPKIKTVSTACQQCATSFGFFRWRHHCRKCGRCLCSTCLPRSFRRKFEGHEKPVPTCAKCVFLLDSESISIGATRQANDGVEYARIVEKCMANLKGLQREQETPPIDGATSVVIRGTFDNVPAVVKLYKQTYIMSRIQRTGDSQLCSMSLSMESDVYDMLRGNNCVPDKLLGLVADCVRVPLLIIKRYDQFGTLHEVLQRTDLSLRWDWRIGALYQVAKVLYAMHSLGISHCDIRAGNVLVSSTEDITESIKVFDFSSAFEFCSMKENWRLLQITDTHTPPEILELFHCQPTPGVSRAVEYQLDCRSANRYTLMCTRCTAGCTTRTTCVLRKFHQYDVSACSIRPLP
jgi:Ras-related protein Rab-8A